MGALGQHSPVELFALASRIDPNVKLRSDYPVCNGAAVTGLRPVLSAILPPPGKGRVARDPCDLADSSL